MSQGRKIELSRSSQRWSEVANAGGFALRYADPLLSWLTAIADSPEDAQAILTYTLNHLAQKGFGATAKGRLADHLLRVAARVTRVYYKKLRPEVEVAEMDPDVDDSRWLEPWTANLLVRAWRSLERVEHANRKAPLYTLLQLITQDPESSEAELVERLYREHGFRIDVAEFPRAVSVARRRFAQCLADEVAETLMSPTDGDIMQELQRLGLDDLVAPYVKSPNDP